MNFGLKGSPVNTEWQLYVFLRPTSDFLVIVSIFSGIIFNIFIIHLCL
jgi:hypothetical protein